MSCSAAASQLFLTSQILIDSLFVKAFVVFFFMASSQSSILFDDLFTVKDVNPGGRKFDRGMSRFLVEL